jgi:hypothetical protein
MNQRTSAAKLCLLLSLPLLGACAKKDTDATAGTDTLAASSTASTTTSVAAPPAMALDSFAGKWNVTSTPTSGANKSPTKYVLTATNNTSGWTLTFPNRPPVPAQVTVAGDSVQISAGPYESVRRKGVQVTTDGYIRLSNGKLVGSTTAHYAVKTADSVLVLTTEGTRGK